MRSNNTSESTRDDCQTPETAATHFASAAADIGSFDITPSWERPQPVAQEPPDPIRQGIHCQCPFCQLAAAGHL